MPRNETPTTPGVLVVGPVDKVRPTDQLTGDPTPPRVDLLAARNEFVSFQVVIQAGLSELPDVDVAVGAPLSGSAGALPAEAITIYREEYYEVREPSDREGAPGLWPDILIPRTDPWFGQDRSAFPITVPAGQNRVAWVDVLVPQEAMPGAYHGTLAVTGAGFTADVAVELTVIDAELPSTSTLTTAFGLGYESVCRAAFGDTCYNAGQNGWQLNALLCRIALENRITICRPNYDALTPGNVAPFEQHVLPLLNGTAPTRLPGARLTSIQVEPTQLATWQAAAQRHGFADRAFLYACDEPGTDCSSWADCRQNAAAAQTWPELPVLVTASIDQLDGSQCDPPDLGRDAFVNWLVVLVNLMHEKGGPSRRDDYNAFLGLNPRNQLWLYTSCMSHGCEPDTAIEKDCQQDPAPAPAAPDPPDVFDGWPGYVIDQPGAQARAMGWFAYRYQAQGELYFDVGHCLPTAWTAQYAFGGNGDGTLFYPGDPSRIAGSDWIPLESMRLKLIRDGHQDYEYLRLAAAVSPAGADSIANTLFPRMDDTDATGGDILAARHALAKLIDPARAL
ncbi:DUF4091 domain-containing protein [Kocuria sp. CPCC 205258]|uniref:DUF4091 domain-containing protein n=1 Tax=Kocuria sp. CPCC 205258 TaxID=3073552 RepID=UPI0034D6F5AF